MGKTLPMLACATAPEGAAIRPLTDEKEILDGCEWLLTECIEIKGLGKLHAASEAKEGGIPALTGDRRRLIVRSRGIFLPVDALARHNHQAAQNCVLLEAPPHACLRAADAAAAARWQ